MGGQGGLKSHWNAPEMAPTTFYDRLRISELTGWPYRDLARESRYGQGTPMRFGDSQAEL